MKNNLKVILRYGLILGLVNIAFSVLVYVFDVVLMGMFAGFFAGIMYDLFYSGLFGFTALIFIYIGYFSGFFYQKYEVREVLIPLALVITADFGYGFISYIGNFLLQNRLNVGFFMSRFILPEVVYTALVSLLIYHPIHYFCVITEQGKERKKKGKIDEVFNI